MGGERRAALDEQQPGGDSGPPSLRFLFVLWLPPAVLGCPVHMTNSKGGAPAEANPGYPQLGDAALLSRTLVLSLVSAHHVSFGDVRGVSQRARSSGSGSHTE